MTRDLSFRRPMGVPRTVTPSAAATPREQRREHLIGSMKLVLQKSSYVVECGRRQLLLEADMNRTAETWAQSSPLDRDNAFIALNTAIRHGEFEAQQLQAAIEEFVDLIMEAR